MKQLAQVEEMRTKYPVSVITDMTLQKSVTDVVHPDDARGDAFVATSQFIIIEDFTTQQGGVVSYNSEMSVGWRNE